MDFRRVIDALADAVVASDRTNRVIYANAAAARLLGWSVDDLVGRPLTDLMPERMRAVHQVGFRRHLETGESRLLGRAIKVPALRRDGREVEIELCLAAVPRDDGGEIYVATMRDLSERVELERQLSVTRYMRAATQAAARLTARLDLDQVIRTAVETTTADFGAALARIWLLDPDGRTLILRASAGFSVMTSGSSRARLDIATYPYKVGVVARTCQPFVKNGLAGDPDFDQEWVLREGLGAVAVFPLMCGPGLRGVFASFYRFRLEPEVVEVLATFAVMVSSAIHDADLYSAQQEALRARDEFLSIASHELRTPLTTLRLRLEGLERRVTRAPDDPAGPLRPKLQIAERQLTHLEQLVARLLDVSRLVEGRLALELESVDLGALVGEVVERSRDEIEGAGCRADLRIEQAVVGRWDRLRLEQVVQNLLSNAAKYGRGAPIEVTVSDAGADAVLSVRDHGVGVAVADQERIFARFERAVSASKYGGLGLGLWITKELVSAMGGSIGVESAPGQGARFTARLPKAGPAGGARHEPRDAS